MTSLPLLRFSSFTFLFLSGLLLHPQGRKSVQQAVEVVQPVVFQFDAPGLSALRHAHLAPEHLLEMARAFAEIIDTGGLCCRFSLRFLQKLRDEQRFPNFDALKAQIAADAAAARAFFKL